MSRWWKTSRNERVATPFQPTWALLATLSDEGSLRGAIRKQYEYVVAMTHPGHGPGWLLVNPTETTGCARQIRFDFCGAENVPEELSLALTQLADDERNAELQVHRLVAFQGCLLGQDRQIEILKTTAPFHDVMHVWIDAAPWMGTVKGTPRIEASHIHLDIDWGLGPKGFLDLPLWVLV